VLLTTTAFRRGGWWWFLVGILLALDFTAAIGSFSKMPIILAFIPVIFGYMLYRPGMRGLRWIPIILVVLYLASNSIVSYGRDQGLEGRSFLGRLNLAKSFIDPEQIAFSVQKNQNWWVRFNYANIQAFTMEEYNEGRPGESFALAWIAPIPRILWPQKPDIESGYGLYGKLTGQQTASFGIGFFAEAYWNGGWLYVILCSVVIGWLLGTVTLQITNELLAGNLWIFPIAMLWIRCGGRVDGWFHTEIVGPAVFTLLYIGLMRFMSLGKPITSRKPLSRRRRVPADNKDNFISKEL
jgi:hypothetical protein